jgi:hypothetical protein
MYVRARLRAAALRGLVAPRSGLSSLRQVREGTSWRPRSFAAGAHVSVQAAERVAAQCEGG